MAVKTRTGMKCGCPICSRHKVLAGFNDLGTTHPEIAAQWDYERNDKKPSDYLSGSNVKVWWKCKKQPHSYLMSIVSRTQPKYSGCPYCSGKRVLEGFNDLATTHPDVAAQWDFERNTLLPTQVTYASSKKVWWKCEKCSGSYLMAVSQKGAMHLGCPYCSGNRVLQGYNDLASQCPNIAAEWDYEKNNIAPTEISCGSKRKVWWKCRKCGHSWQAQVYNRTKEVRATGCPKCGIQKRSKANSKPVICVETQQIYSGVVDAENQTGINRRFISACCKGTRNMAGGYHWKYDEN